MPSTHPKHFDLKPKSVHIWFANLNNTVGKQTDYYVLLSDEEKKRADKFHFPKDHNQFVVSKGILRLLSGQYLDQNPKNIVFKQGHYGKPIYADENRLKFNISHSGDMIVLGFVKDIEIGVDIEKIKDDFDVMDIANNFFSTKEIASLKALPENMQPRAFYRCWTRKESFIKAEGSGLSFPLDSFTVSLDDDGRAELLETKWDSSEKHKWSLFTFTPATDYICATAIRGKVHSIEYFDCEEFI